MTLLLYLIIISLVFGHLPSVFIASQTTITVHDFLIILWTILYISSRQKLRKNTLFFPSIAFILSGFMSLIVNIWNFSSFELFSGGLYLFRWVLYAVFFFCVSSFVHIENKREEIKILLYISGVFFGIVGIIQIALYPSLRNLVYLGWDPHYYRLFSTLFDPNFAGIWLVTTIILGLYIYLKLPFWFYVISQLITIIALILTYSRSSYLAFFVGLLVWILRKKSWKFLGMIVLFMCLFVFIPKTQLDVIRLDRWQSSVVRVENWQYNLQLIKTKPLFGYGFNTLPFIRPGKSEGSSRAGAGLDNSFLFVWAASGIFGIGTFLWLLYSMWKVPFFCQNEEKKADGEALVTSVLVSISIHSLFNNSWFFSWVILWLWLLLSSLIRPISDK